MVGLPDGVKKFEDRIPACDRQTDRPELTTGQWVVGNGSTDLDGSRGSWVSIRDPLTHE